MSNGRIIIIQFALGENNAGKPDNYNCTFVKLIEHWRSIWYARSGSLTDPTFPFGFVQVR